MFLNDVDARKPEAMQVGGAKGLIPGAKHELRKIERASNQAKFASVFRQVSINESSASEFTQYFDTAVEGCVGCCKGNAEMRVAGGEDVARNNQ